MLKIILNISLTIIVDNTYIEIFKATKAWNKKTKKTIRKNKSNRNRTKMLRMVSIAAISVLIINNRAQNSKIISKIIQISKETQQAKFKTSNKIPETKKLRNRKVSLSSRRSTSNSRLLLNAYLSIRLS